MRVPTVISLCSSSLNPWLTVAAATGLLAHNVLFIRGTWHLQAPGIILSHLVLAAALCYFLPKDAASTVGAHVLRCILICGSYLASLLTSMTVYRLFFHKLRNFPGPRVAAATKLWHVLHCLTAKNYLLLHKIHQRYGPFVRTGPNEISVFYPAVTDLLDHPKSKTARTDWYEVLEPRTSVIFTRSEAEHAQRRRTWTRAFSNQSITTYLPRIIEQVNTLAQLVADHKGEPVYINDVMSWFSFDSMGEFMFNESFGMMKSSEWHPAIVQQRGALALLAPMGQAIWIVRLAFAFVPWFGKVREWFQMVAFCDKQMEKRISTNPTAPDIAAWFIQDFHKYADTQSLELRKNLLSGSTITAIIAGSDTTRPALVNLWYMLASHPATASKCYAEVRDVDPADLHTFENLPHLNGTVNETLRLLPPAMTGGNRLTPPEGLHIGDTWIPGGTVLSAPKYTNMRLPSAFEHPDAFIPERWYSRPDLIHEKRAFTPFGGHGYRECVGKNLALVEIRLVAAILLKRFDVRFADGYDPGTLERDMLDQVTCQPGDLWCVFEEREGI